MPTTLGGTLALVGDELVMTDYGTAMTFSSDADVIPAAEVRSALHHDTVLVGIHPRTVAESGTALRTLVAGPGRVFALCPHVADADLSEYERALVGLDAVAIVALGTVRVLEVAPSDGPGSLARAAWLESTTERLSGHEDDEASGSTAAQEEDAEAETDEEVDEASAKRRSLRKRVVALARDKRVLGLGGLVLIGGAGVLGWQVGGSVLAGVRDAVVVALLAANLLMMMLLRRFVGGMNQRDVRHRRDLRKYNMESRRSARRLTDLVGEVRRDQTVSRTVETMILETLTDMERR